MDEHKEYPIKEMQDVEYDEIITVNTGKHNKILVKIR